MPKINDVIAYTLRCASRSSTAAYSPGLLKPLFTICKVGWVDRLHADEDPLAARRRNQIDQFLIAQQIGADLRHPMHLRFRGNDVAQQRFRALHVDGEIVVDEEHRNLAALAFARAFSSSSSFTTLSLVRKRIESPKNPVTVQNSQP